MEEFLHQMIVYPIICEVLNIPGGLALKMDGWQLENEFPFGTKRPSLRNFGCVLGKPPINGLINEISGAT